MKTLACWTLTMALAATSALAQRNEMEDLSADQALLSSRDPSVWQVGLAYANLSRAVDLDGFAATLRGNVIDATIGVSPWPWLLFYGQVGGSSARLDPQMREDAGFGGGGLFGANLNVWQLYEGVEATAWRVTLKLAGQYAYRTAADDGEGELRWGETLVLLPLDYHLSFARSFRNYYTAEFQSLHFYVGPAFSKLNGTWNRGGQERDFAESQPYGVVGGAELWLLDNLSFGARADWFDGTSIQLSILYRF
jgi:hypothetical protein